MATEVVASEKSKPAIQSWPSVSLRTTMAGGAWPQAPLKTSTTICNWAAPQVTGKGELVWQTVASVISFGLMIWGIAETQKIFDMRYDIAKAYANLATEQWNRFRDGYIPLETSMLNVCKAATKITPDYAKARTEGQEDSNWAFSSSAAEMSRMAKRYKMCLDPSLETAWNVDKATDNDDMVNFNYRDQERNALAEDEQRWNNRSNLLNLGRGHLANSYNYASGADALLKPLGAMATNMTSGAAEALGYLYDRNWISYPSFFTTSTSPGGMTGFENLQLGGVQA